MVLVWLLGLGWGVLVAMPLVGRGRRAALIGRMEHVDRGGSVPVAAKAADTHDTRVRRFVARAVAVRDGIGGPVARVVADLRRRRRARGVDGQFARDLPVALDLLGVAVDAGCTPFLAVQTAATWAPPMVAEQFVAVLRACRLGVSFDRALGDVAREMPQLRALVDALLTSDRLGAPVGPMLARLASEERTALRRRAETHARRVPVRLLFPLVFLVLPAFVLLTVVPGLAAGISRL
ncbi:MAG TPA: type II secretion system F family protein [Acidimicrobiia bacterium]|nr:type II secretion system F family protein [Acidimicrobiia bacterium]